MIDPRVVFEYPSDQTPFGVSFSDVAQVIQANLKDAGITVNLQPEPLTVYIKQWSAGKVQMGIEALGGNTLDASGMAKYVPGGFVAKWMQLTVGLDPATDAIAAQILGNTDPSRTASLFIQEQTVINEFAVFTPLFLGPFVIVASKTISGINQNGLGISYFSELT